MQLSPAPSTPIRTAVPGAGGRGWIRSPAWDVFWVLNTLWVVPLVIWGLQADPDPRDNPVHTLYLVLTLFFWVGHRFSSAYLAYFTLGYRPLLRSQRTRFVWVPLGIAVATFAFLVPGNDVLPWPRSVRIMYLIIVDYALITYHFASQHFGFLSLYALRAGRPRNPMDRRLDRWFALGVGGVLVFVAELIAGTVFYQDVWLDPVFDPDWLARVHDGVQLGGPLLVGLATLGLLARDGLGGYASLPRALYLLSLGGLVTTAFFVSPFVFIVLWATQHWIAAMGLATVVAGGDPRTSPHTEARGWYGLWAGFSRHPWRLVLLLAAVSALLLPVMEVEALAADEVGFAEALVPRIAHALETSAWVPALIALGFTTAFLHYALDRAVFRLSNPDVRTAARGLFR